MQVQKPKQGYTIIKSSFGKYEEIPKEWSYSTFKEVLELIIDHRGITPKKLGGNWSEKGIPTISAMNINSGKLVRPEEIRYVDSQMYERWMPEKLLIGDVILTSEAPLGEAYYVENPNFCLGQRLFGLRSRKSLTDSKFLYYFIISEVGQDELHKRSTGTTVKGIRQAELVKISILLPLLKEQQKISSILSNVDSLIQQTQKEIEQTQKLKKGLMQKLLTKGIGHTKFKESSLKVRFLKLSIPENWEVDSLNHICKIIDTPHYTSPLFEGEIIPVITTADFDPNGQIDYSKVNFTSKEEYLERSKIIDPKIGDVLFTREAPLGIAALVDKKEISVGQRIILLKINNEVMTDKFLVSFLNSAIGRIQSNSLAIKTTVERVNLNDIKQFRIPIPPLAEQQKIAHILSNVDYQIELHQECKLQLENIKKELMQKLLTGQIRVKV